MLSSKKYKFEKILFPFSRLLKKINISPNQVTISSIIFSIFVFYTIVTYHFLLGTVLLIITSFLDSLDGFLARDTKKVTKLGAYLDTIADRYVEFIVLLSLLFVNLPEIFFPIEVWIILCVFGSLMTTYSKSAYSEKTNKKIYGGLIERPERMIILIMCVFFLNIELKYSSYILIIFALLTNITAIQRIIKSIKLCIRE